MGRGWVARLGERCPLRGSDGRLHSPGGEESPPEPLSLPGEGRASSTSRRGAGGLQGQLRGCAVPALPCASTQGGDEGTHNSGVPCRGRGRCAALAQAAPACPGPLVPRLGMLLFSNLFNGINLSKMDNPCFPHLMLEIHCVLKTSCRNDFGCF